MNNITTLFDDALNLSIEKAAAAQAEIGKPVILVRDLKGRIRVLLTGKNDDYDDKKAVLDKFSKDLEGALGVYGFPSHRMILFESDLEHGEHYVHSPDRMKIQDGLFLLDRQIVGQDWLRQPFTRSSPNPRVTFYGVKGGVGRSTALIIWAWHLAKQGKRVLIFDLDLESPGVSSTLLPLDNLPDYGIVDWFVEDAVGQGSVIEREVTATSPVSSGLSGDIRIIPSYGRKTDHYLPKLSRCYSDSWAERLDQFVSTMESAEKPDVVILDSRAGIHDIAAAAITRMDADTFLFAADSPQTWSSYAFLFKHIKQHHEIDSIRKRLQIVASMVPETLSVDYLRRFRENAWDVFRDNLYDATDGSTSLDDPFSFDLNDEEAPHFPWPVYWHRALQEFYPTDSTHGIDEKIIETALGSFMGMADRLIGMTEER